ncbi:MAG: carbamoyltransferase HypF [Armatimonadota bacterium]|nr:carbamoyltransferase HypF [Armatimonadota bacterium]MDR7426634.1 carbamoyltransferase HypF [Armatimonadota bacterium]MDR7468654.1 carbamoyltransferase HypF [Armatimonadota bacterium]MDR7473777.1 carbamoyltransferase HypF [Armatimonadota bacterium]MDR7538160.1 carbamoyltransferase HypF [Armatimonadota bacterium]
MADLRVQHVSRQVRKRPRAQESPAQRLRVTIRGAVQGVGYRPFVYRLATETGLAGWVSNTTQGVFIEVEGPQEALRAFLRRVQRERPPRAAVVSLDAVYLDAVGFVGFQIRESTVEGARTVAVLPDIATCPDCLRELFDPRDRRYRYPFINCTNCGPRFSIIENLPYDRPNTTMRGFAMCPACRAEYDDPLDRRFHAQPIACPVCGPHLALWDERGRVLAVREAALQEAAAALRRGAIVALKGLGGFQLLVDARSEEAVQRLRHRKRREEKPFALLYPSLQAARRDCLVSGEEAALLVSPEAPIVLLRRRAGASVAAAVAPGNPFLGVMLPYSPLHHLLMTELGFPVVATSGNLAEEPIVTDEREALDRLSGIADLFLVHDRPIARHVDDSVARVVLGRPLLLRRARGYAPLPVTLRGPAAGDGTLLAVGGHLKNTVALAVGEQVFISQHIGTLETAPAYEAFIRVIADFSRLYQAPPRVVACDAHPDYLSTQHAERWGLPLLRVQHHHAHVLACMAEHELDGPVLGVAWDGSGDGMDGTVWGGEFLLVTAEGFSRVASFRRFPLPGGEQAVREPRRTAVGLLHAAFGDPALEMVHLAPVASFSAAQRQVLRQMLARGVNSPACSSVGRLFDAMAALLGIRQRCSFEGQAAMELEFLLDGVTTREAYPLPVTESADAAGRLLFLLDWEPMVRAVLDDQGGGSPAGLISARFHNALVEATLAVARRIGEERVLLTGGCFQNAYLLERAVRRLRGEGFRPYWHQRIPPNDGGLSLGQVVGARLQREE